MIAVQAELTQAPFDMPIAESELVSGYMTEYSGFRFLIFFIGEFATAGVFAFLAAVLFLGGWGVPFAWFGWETLGDVDNWMNVVGPVIMLTKMMLLVGIIMWVRFSYPRFREDQLQTFAWKVLIPLSLANIAGPIIMLTKMMLLTGIIMWVRFSYPRLREDQLQTFAWKVLIPLSLVNIAITAILKVAV